MKIMLYPIAALLLLSGCSQSKNRLADDSNVEYQKRNASKITKPQPNKSEVVDISNAQAESEKVEDKTQSAEPALSIPIPTRNETVEAATTPSAPVPQAKKPTSPATAAPVVTAPTPTATPKAPTPPVAHRPAAPQVLTYEEYVAIHNVLKGNFSVPEEMKVILEGFINVEQNPEINTQKLAPAVMGTFENLSAAILHDGRPLTQIMNQALTLDGKLLLADASNGYKFHAACALQNCEILFVGFYKFTGDKVSSNLPCFFKRVSNQYVIAVSKTKEYYDEEAQKRASQAPAAAPSK